MYESERNNWIDLVSTQIISHILLELSHITQKNIKSGISKISFFLNMIIIWKLRKLLESLFAKKKKLFSKGFDT